MQQRPLGRTGLLTSVLGYGAFKLGRNQEHRFEADYKLPTEAESTRLLNQVLDAGRDLLIDTAPAYGLSEERIGRAIGHRRDEFVLATKVGESFTEHGSCYDFSRAAVVASIERSLNRLRTDRLDVVCVHSDGRDLAIQHDTDVVATLDALKTAGTIRAVGFSAKTVAGIRAANKWADVLMLTYNINDRTNLPVMEEAAAAGVGVIVKKGLASGRTPAAMAIPFVLNQGGVSSLLIGSLSEAHVRDDIAIAEQCDAG